MGIDGMIDIPACAYFRQRAVGKIEHEKLAVPGSVIRVHVKNEFSIEAGDGRFAAYRMVAQKDGQDPNTEDSNWRSSHRYDAHINPMSYVMSRCIMALIDQLYTKKRPIGNMSYLAYVNAYEP